MSATCGTTDLPLMNSSSRSTSRTACGCSHATSKRWRSSASGRMRCSSANSGATPSITSTRIDAAIQHHAWHTELQGQRGHQGLLVGEAEGVR